MPSKDTVSQTASQKKKITWDELRQHRTPKSSWLAYLGKVYDVTEWGKTHPGGDMIFLGGGTDASILVNSYHPSGINEKLLEKYCIGEMVEDKKHQSYYDDLQKDDFYNVLKERVVKVFKDKGIHYKGETNKEMYIKTLIIMVGYILSYYFMCMGYYIGSIFTGVFSAEIGMSIMHDGSHGAYSQKKWLNWATSWLMDFIGASSYVWEVQHVAGHHIHTNNNNTNANDIEVDPDVFSSYPFIRMHPNSERKWYHKYQHYYSIPLFALFTFTKVLYSDMQNFYESTIYHLSMQTRLYDALSWFRIVLMKFLTIFYLLVLPIYFNGLWKGFLLYFIFHNVVGTILACMFQVTHLSEGCSFLQLDRDPVITDIQKQSQEELRVKHNIKQVKPHQPRSWAALQCQTSANWALDSWFMTHFSGGLNHQIEHHLFPGICHVHYPFIQPVVEKTCAEYGVSYINHPDFMSAFWSLISYLKTLGNPPRN